MKEAKQLTAFLPCSILHLQHNKAWSQASGTRFWTAKEYCQHFDLTGSLAKMRAPSGDLGRGQDWSKTHVPLGKGFSFYILQVYQGRIIIRNVEMFMEPLLHIEPFRLKMMGFAMSIVEKMSSCKLSRDKVKKAVLVWFCLLSS
ncbi:hypothetical protein NC652_035884 [Populus alba x Populus x berolinensis]|nr:hypothetical protein NC652_035884 [Populus alba x Populus x berolinensis]